MATADLLADLVQDSPDLELRRRPVTGVVNWCPRHQSAEQVRARLQDGPDKYVKFSRQQARRRRQVIAVKPA